MLFRSKRRLPVYPSGGTVNIFKDSTVVDFTPRSSDASVPPSKVDPYLRLLYDALYQIMGAESYLHNVEKGLIEVAPLAYMRGRTLDNAFIILDEAQNTTPAQMKMFLTRIGFGSKVIVTGDITQKDLPYGQISGLDVAMRVLSKVEDIAFIKLTNQDVVRHPLVQKIVMAYEEYEKAHKVPEKRSYSNGKQSK